MVQNPAVLIIHVVLMWVSTNVSHLALAPSIFCLTGCAIHGMIYGDKVVEEMLNIYTYDIKKK